MLNYLRDPNLEELPAEQQTETVHQKEKDFLTVATRKKDVRRSTSILGVLFIIGLICLGLMIKKSAPQTAAAADTIDTEELQIETAIAKLTGIQTEMFNRMDEIVNKFYEFSDVFQVRVSELAKNPFELETIINTLNSDEDGPKIDAGMILRQQIILKAKDMKLYSVMQSQKGVCCMIDNKILYEGDTIEDFVVKEISNDNAILEMGDIEITLKISK